MTQLPDLTGKVKIDTSQVKGAFSDLRSSANALMKDMQSSFEREGSAALGALIKNANGVELALKGAAGAATFVAGAISGAAAASVAAFTVANKALLEYSDRVVTLSQRTGLSTTALQVFGHMAKVSGTDLESLSKAVTRMEVNIGKGSDAFKKMGLSLTDLRALSPDAAFEKVGAAIGSISDPMQQAAAAVAVFGKSGAELLPVFATDLGKAREEAERLGLVLGEGTLKASEALGDALDTAAEAAGKFAMHAAGVVQESPALIAVVEQASEVFGELSRVIEANRATLVEWSNVLVLMAADLLSTVAALGQMAVGIGKMGGMSWAIELSGVQKLTDGFREMAEALERAVIEKIRWKAIDMGGKGVLLPGVDLPKQGKTGRTFDASDPAAAAAAAVRAAEKLSKAQDDWWAGARKYSEELDKIQTKLDSIVEKALRADYGGMEQRAHRASLSGAVESALAGSYTLAVPTGMDGKPKQFSLDNSRNASGGYGALITPATAELAKNLQALSNIFALSTSAFAKSLASITGSASGLADGIQLLQKGGFGSGLTGILGKAGVIGQIATAGIGIISGIKSLFGGGAKKRQEEADRKAAADAAAAQAAKEEHDRRVAGFGTMATGLNKFTQGGGITDQASSDRAGRFAMATFGAQVRDNGDIFGALDSISPALQAMAESAERMGLALPAGVASLLQLQGLDDGLKESVSGLNMMTKGIEEAGLSTQSMFNDLGAEALATRDRLTEAGLTGAQSLAVMQPTLQQLYEMQKLHGYAVDETTQAMIDEAEAQGIVGDQFMSANERMVELLGILIETIGGKLPDSYKRAGDAAEDYARRASNIPIPTIPGDPTEPSEPSPPKMRGGSHGLRDFGSESIVALHNREAVVPEDEYKELVNGGGGWAGPVANLGKALGDVVGDIGDQIAELATAVAKMGEQGGNVVIQPNIAVAVDAGSVRRNQAALLENVEDQVAVSVRRGTSPILAALRDRGIRPGPRR